MAWLRQPVPAAVLAAMVALVAMIALREAGAVERLELMAYDEFVRLRSRGDGYDHRVVQIAIDEHDLQRFGWPVSDGVLADAIRKIRASHPRAIGIDILRPLPVGPGSDSLDQVITDTPQLVWVDRFSEAGWQGIPAPAAASSAGRVGFADLVLDPGLNSRRALLYLNDSNRWEEAFSLKLAFSYLAAEGIVPAAGEHQWLRLGHVLLPPIEPSFGGYADVDARGYQILREFRPPARIARSSLSDLLDGRIPDDWLANRIVVVGVIADSVKDFVNTPLDGRTARGSAGSTVQALFAAQLLLHAIDGFPPTRPLPRSAELVVISVLGICGTCAGIFLRRGGALAALIAIGAALITGASYGLFLRAVWLPLVPMLSAWLLTSGLAALALARAESAQRGLLMRLFSVYLSEPIAQEIWEKRGEITQQGRPVPLRLSATILFSDINEFTTVSEALDPEAVVSWLHQYMEEMTAIVDRWDGVVERFQGDGTLAMWGVPIARTSREEIAADANSAVLCALEMRQALARLNQLFRAEKLPEMKIGIGIYSGELVGCTLGTAARQQYTTIGDTTNTAARLVTIAKDLMKAERQGEICQIVIGGTTRALLRDDVLVKPLGKFALKGKSQTIECFEVVGGGRPDSFQKMIAAANSQPDVKRRR